jgi:hypothetical protein
VDYALVGALGMVQLVFRVAGGIGAGTARYPKFLATIHRAPLPFLLALDVGGIVGAAMWVAPYLVGALQDRGMAGWRSRRSWAAASSAPVC